MNLRESAGIALGARVPESWSLDFALPLTFLAILVPLAAGIIMIVALAFLISWWWKRSATAPPAVRWRPP